MTSVNQSVTLFSAQATDATGSAVLLEPGIKDRTRIYDIVLSGGLGGGTFTMTVSHDSTDGTDGTFVTFPTYAQSTIGFINDIEVSQRLYVKGVLTGATSATLTAKLYYRFK